MSITVVYFDQTDATDDGEPYGNAITDTSDPIEYGLTLSEFEAQYPDHVYNDGDN